MKKTAGIFPCSHGLRIEGTQRSCVQDYFINACAQFDIYFDKNMFYNEFIIHPTLNTGITTVKECKII